MQTRDVLAVAADDRQNDEAATALDVGGAARDERRGGVARDGRGDLHTRRKL